MDRPSPSPRAMIDRDSSRWPGLLLSLVPLLFVSCQDADPAAPEPDQLSFDATAGQVAVAGPIGPPYSTRPHDTDCAGNCATRNSGGFFRDANTGATSLIYWLGTDVVPGSLILDFSVRFSDGPGNDIAILTSSESWGVQASTASFSLYLAGNLVASFDATLAPDALFEFDIPGVGVVADRIVVTNTTPDPSGTNSLATMAFIDAGVVARKPGLPCVQFVDENLKPVGRRFCREDADGMNVQFVDPRSGLGFGLIQFWRNGQPLHPGFYGDQGNEGFKARWNNATRRLTDFAWTTEGKPADPGNIPPATVGDADGFLFTSFDIRRIQFTKGGKPAGHRIPILTKPPQNLIFFFGEG